MQNINPYSKSALTEEPNRLLPHFAFLALAQIGLVCLPFGLLAFGIDVLKAAGGGAVMIFSLPFVLPAGVLAAYRTKQLLKLFMLVLVGFLALIFVGLVLLEIGGLAGTQ